eukprot:Nitzschia sp. Nitz4//scaffold110_size71422//60210//61815//NITZ4_005884-RA/size71422-augustus-gene-0.16-mRNA-1//-1//CDS//3329533119//4227//frame0
MAPDADKLRQRNTHKEDAAEATTGEKKCTLAGLSGSEIVIDGVIYDISDFKHPGGESIRIFGGNDVSVHYRMIHHNHSGLKSLEKLKRVGTIADYSAEYKFNTPFELELKAEVFKVVGRGREFGTFGWFSRAFFYISLFFSLQYLWVTSTTSYALAIVYGVSQAFIGLNVQHDANHGAASKTPWINDLLGLGADFIGGSKWLWMEQHWTHHAFTNQSKDPDSYGAEPWIVFNDYPPGDKRRGFVHHFQAFYYILPLAGYWVSTIFNPEIFDLRQRGALGVGMNMDSDYVHKSRKYAIFLRFLYIYTNCIAPFQNQGWSWDVFGHIIIMGVASSLTLSILFALSHNFENADREPTNPTKTGGEPVCWYKSQVETSCSYGGFISGCVTGGLNMQIEHHIFPRMSSAWYPYIAPTVRRVCEKHGVRYTRYPWIWENLYSTVKYLHQAGTGSNWKDGNPYSGKN